MLIVAKISDIGGRNHSCPFRFQTFNIISKDFALLLTDLANQMVNLVAIITFDLTSTQLSGMSPNVSWADETYSNGGRAALSYADMQLIWEAVFAHLWLECWQFTGTLLLHCRVYKPLKHAGWGCVPSDYDELPAAYQHELAYGVRTWLDGMSINLSMIWMCSYDFSVPVVRSNPKMHLK